MKLLVILEKVDVNDERFLYINGQIRDLAKSAKSIIVLCLEKVTELNIPNVRVLSLGKDNGRSKFSYLSMFYRVLMRERKNYDKVLVYRSPIYILLGGLVWKFFNKPVVLWYNHMFQNNLLKIATSLSTIIVSPGKKGFPFETPKLKIVEGTEFTELMENL